MTRLTPVLERPLENSLIACVLTLIRPIALGVPPSANQMFPSGPKVGIPGTLPAFRPTLNSWIAWLATSLAVQIGEADGRRPASPWSCLGR